MKVRTVKIKIIMLSLLFLAYCFLIFITLVAPDKEGYTEEVPCYDERMHEIQELTCIKEYGSYNNGDRLVAIGVFTALSITIALAIILGEL